MLATLGDVAAPVKASTGLPVDATLLPLRGGELLVSRSHAVFCPVPADELPALRRVLEGRAGLGELGADLREALDRHGFFAAPRPVEPDPPSVQIQLTNGCNLGCTYCCTNSGAPRRAELAFETLAALAPRLREVVGEGGRVALLGGEPFLVPWAIDLAERLADEGYQLTVFTNGTLLAREALARRVAALVARGGELRVSLAGPTAEICDQVSHAARFDAVMAGVDELARCGARAVVDLMVLPEHVEAVCSHFHALKQRLPAGTRVTLGLLYLSGREQGEHLFGSRAVLEAALDRIAFEAGEVISAPRRSPTAYRREGCGCAMGNHLHIRSDGALFSCFKMEERVGHLADEDFVAAARRVRESPHPARLLPACTECALATLCGGGCRSDNLLYTGDPDGVVCGPWRVRVLCELLAEGLVGAVDWPVHHLLAEAHLRGIEAPERIAPARPSRHLVET